MRQLKISKQVTNRDTLSLDKYLHEIGKVELLTAEKEVELAKRIKNGDRLALEQLIKGNLRFVVSVSKQYQNQGLSLPDLTGTRDDGSSSIISFSKPEFFKPRAPVAFFTALSMLPSKFPDKTFLSAPGIRS